MNAAQWGVQLANAHLTNVLVSVTMIIIALLGLEVATRLVVDTTAASDQVLIQQRWMTNHWNPINMLGYRDDPIEDNLDENRQQIIITGDSYASGWGVKDFDDTFGQRIANCL